MTECFPDRYFVSHFPGDSKKVFPTTMFRNMQEVEKTRAVLLDNFPALKSEEDTLPTKDDIGAYILYFAVDREETPVVISTDKASDFDCSVCYKPFSETLTNCGHRFCMTCALKWTQVNEACAICREMVSYVSIQRFSVETPVANKENDPTQELLTERHRVKKRKTT